MKARTTFCAADSGNATASSDAVAQASPIVTFTRMDQGTAEDYALLDELAKPYIAKTGERALAYLENLSEGFPGYPVDRLQHSLQTATRAFRAGECEEIVVAALLHDIGDDLAPENHSELGASVLRPYVARHTYWMVLQHGLFQGYHYFDKIGLDPDARLRYRDHPAFDMTVHFCDAYDQNSFDPDYDTLAIDHFVPMVERIFARKPWGDHATCDWPVRAGRGAGPDPIGECVGPARYRHGVDMGSQP